MNLELCSNCEWWRVFGPLDTDDDDVVNEVIGAVCRALEDAGHVVELSRGRRAMCHGWNGANTFARKYGGLGTFDRASETDWDAAAAIYDTTCIAISKGTP